MKYIKYSLLFLFCLGPNIPAWLVIVLLRMLFGRRMAWRKDAAWTELAEGSWFRKHLYPGYDPVTGRLGWGGTTLGPHAGFVNYGELDTDILEHETVHTEQYEVEAIQNFAMGLASWLLGAPLWVGLVWWSGAGLLAMLCGFVVAWLRGEPAYRGSVLEEAAYNSGSACRVGSEAK